MSVPSVAAAAATNVRPAGGVMRSGHSCTMNRLWIFSPDRVFTRDNQYTSRVHIEMRPLQLPKLYCVMNIKAEVAPALCHLLLTSDTKLFFAHWVSQRKGGDSLKIPAASGIVTQERTGSSSSSRARLLLPVVVVVVVVAVVKEEEVEVALRRNFVRSFVRSNV